MAPGCRPEHCGTRLVAASTVHVCHPKSACRSERVDSRSLVTVTHCIGEGLLAANAGGRFRTGEGRQKVRVDPSTRAKSRLPIRRHPAVLSRLAVMLRDGCEEFELDVVGISKDQHRGVGFVSNR